MANLSYLGTGLSSPVRLENGRGVAIAGTELINASIERILSTPVGTKYFLREYGSRIHELQFQPNDLALLPLLRTFIKEALAQWEGRIRVESIDTEQNDTSLTCSITYRVLASNEVSTFVYPFYSALKY